MDKEFEDWLMKYNLSEFNPITAGDMQAAWNASKQYWLDRAVDVVDARGQSDFPDSLIEQVILKIKELKE